MLVLLYYVLQYVGVLHGQWQTFLREVEHVEDDRLGASVLTMVDGIHHFHDSLAFMHHFVFAVLADDGQFALHQYAMIHHGMVVPAQLLTGRNLVLYGYQFGAALQIVGQLHAVPTLTGAYQLGALHLLFGNVVLLYETGHQTVGNGGTNPDFREQESSVFVGGFQNDVYVVKYRKNHIYDTNHPQVALRVCFPILARIEEDEHEYQYYRERDTSQMERVINQWGWKENVAQQYGDAHTHGAPVVELICGDTHLEEIHRNHY